MSQPMFKLYHYWRSSSSWRVRLALAHKGIAFEPVAVDLLSDDSDSPEHKSRNPMGYVPVLEDFSKPGHFLAESTAIIEWLEESFPNPSFMPKNPWGRARVRELAQIINSGTQPLQNPNVVAAVSQDPDTQKKWTQAWISKGLEAFEERLALHSGLYCFEDELGYADFFLIPQCYSALRFEVDLKQFGRIYEIYERCNLLEIYRQTEPDRFKP